MSFILENERLLLLATKIATVNRLQSHFQVGKYVISTKW